MEKSVFDKMSSRGRFIFVFLFCAATKVDGFQPSPARTITIDRPVQRWKSLGKSAVTRSHGIAPRAVNVLFASPDDAQSGGGEGQKTRSINDLLSELGLSFKIRAEENIQKSKEATSRSRRIFCALVASTYFLIFLFYRAYRGFFVLLPAVFRRVYSRLETTVETDLSLEDGAGASSSVKSPSWKTKVTVSVLATVVTISYVIGGVMRIVSKFFRTVGKTSSVSESFGAAAKEAVDHEDRIRRRMSLSDDGGKSAIESSGSKNDGLSP